MYEGNQAHHICTRVKCLQQIFLIKAHFLLAHDTLSRTHPKEICVKVSAEKAVMVQTKEQSILTVVCVCVCVHGVSILTWRSRGS